MAVKLPTILIGVLGCVAVVSVPYVATALTPPVASRDAFEAFRSGPDGQQIVAEAVEYHPKIRFLIPAGQVALD